MCTIPYLLVVNMKFITNKPHLLVLFAVIDGLHFQAICIHVYDFIGTEKHCKKPFLHKYLVLLIPFIICDVVIAIHYLFICSSLYAFSSWISWIKTGCKLVIHVTFYCFTNDFLFVFFCCNLRVQVSFSYKLQLYVDYGN